MILFQPTTESGGWKIVYLILRSEVFSQSMQTILLSGLWKLVLFHSVETH
jgi:hypothetical protein